ncbi:MAG: hypothetical protein KAU27_02015, partial [Desulfuromonadales bacterium]|nr:hypothetical protein [Desulfuromonadales bacterium]
MILFILAFSLFTNSALAANSQIMPLAEKSLLLDGQIIGEQIIVVGERGHILISADHGVSWQQQEVPTRSTLTSVFFIDPSNGWVAGHDSVILQTRDGGRHWQKVYADPDDERPIFDLWFRDMTYGYAVGAYGLFLATEDGGRSWNPLDFNPATLAAEDAGADEAWQEDSEEEYSEEEYWGIDFHLNQIAVMPNGRILVSAEAGNLYRSDDACRSWLSLPSPYEGSFYGSLPLSQASILAFGLRGHLFRSEDAGNRWSEIESGSQATLNDGIHLHDGRIVLAGLAGTLLVSADQGHSFKLYAQADRAGIVKVLQVADGALILIGDHGVKRLELP